MWWVEAGKVRWVQWVWAEMVRCGYGGWGQNGKVWMQWVEVVDKWFTGQFRTLKNNQELNDKETGKGYIH